MSEHGFDRLARAHANGLSRRQVIRAAIAAAVGLGAESSVGKVGQALAHGIASTACKTCEFDPQTGRLSCGKCSDAPKAASVRNLARHSRDVRVLQKALKARGFTVHGDGEAFVLHQGGKLVRSLVAYSYRSTHGPASGTLYFSLKANQHRGGATAVVSEHKKPLYGLRVARGGHAQRILPDAESSATAVRASNPGPVASIATAPCQTCTSMCSAYGAQYCEYIGAFACEWVENGNEEFEEVPYGCFFEVYEACNAPTATACQGKCTGLCTAKACPPNEVRAYYGCIPCTECEQQSGACCQGECVGLTYDPRNCGACGIVCPPDEVCNYGCERVAGACTSDSDCTDGQTCQAGQCTSSTPVTGVTCYRPGNLPANCETLLGVPLGSPTADESGYCSPYWEPNAGCSLGGCPSLELICCGAAEEQCVPPEALACLTGWEQRPCTPAT